MTCDHVHKKLTGYLDGDLDAADGSAVRGHLRECAACRKVASDEAALRDGLRQLPPVDPPPSLWAGVQAQLAAAEVADAKRPAWRRALVRWLPAAPRFAAGALVGAAAIVTLWWRSHRAPAEELAALPPPAHDVAVAPRHSPPASPADDVTADLAAEPASVTSEYAQAAGELLALANEERPQWSPKQQDMFDARVGELQAKIDRAAEGRARQSAYRELIAYLKRAAIRDDVSLAGGAR